MLRCQNQVQFIFRVWSYTRNPFCSDLLCVMLQTHWRRVFLKEKDGRRRRMKRRWGGAVMREAVQPPWRSCSSWNRVTSVLWSPWWHGPSHTCPGWHVSCCSGPVSSGWCESVATTHWCHRPGWLPMATFWSSCSMSTASLPSRKSLDCSQEKMIPAGNSPPRYYYYSIRVMVNFIFVE